MIFILKKKIDLNDLYLEKKIVFNDHYLEENRF